MEEIFNFNSILQAKQAMTSCTICFWLFNFAHIKSKRERYLGLSLRAKIVSIILLPITALIIIWIPYSKIL